MGVSGPLGSRNKSGIWEGGAKAGTQGIFQADVITESQEQWGH